MFATEHTDNCHRNGNGNRKRRVNGNCNSNRLGNTTAG